VLGLWKWKFYLKAVVQVASRDFLPSPIPTLVTKLPTNGGNKRFGILARNGRFCFVGATTGRQIIRSFSTDGILLQPVRVMRQILPCAWTRWQRAQWGVVPNLIYQAKYLIILQTRFISDWFVYLSTFFICWRQQCSADGKAIFI
jgi:hypothetical protein